MIPLPLAGWSLAARALAALVVALVLVGFGWRLGVNFTEAGYQARDLAQHEARRTAELAEALRTAAGASVRQAARATNAPAAAARTERVIHATADPALAACRLPDGVHNDIAAAIAAANAAGRSDDALPRAANPP